MSATVLEFKPRPRSGAKKLVRALKSVAHVAAQLRDDPEASPEERALGGFLSIHCRALARMFGEAPTNREST